MDAPILRQAAVNNQTEWKTVEYQGMQMHVCTALRVPRNEALSGHGLQWTFTVKITQNGSGPIDDKGDSAKSDRGLVYSTQAIPEGMGFVRGRELIEGG